MVVDFALTDDGNCLLARPRDFSLGQAKRLVGYVKTINGKIEGNEIIIPFEKQNIIDLYALIEKIFVERLKIELCFSDDVSVLLSEGQNEAKKFADFSAKAKSIRNNDVDQAELQSFCGELVKVDFRRTLQPHQLLSAYHLAFSQNACNFSVPGAGKTTTVLAAFHYLKTCSSRNKHVDKLVVIGPLASFYAWKGDYEKCFGRAPNYIALGGGDVSYSDNSFIVSNIAADLVLISYASAPGHLSEIKMLLRNNKCMLVLDEAHWIKNTELKEGSWSGSIMQLAQLAKSRVVLTGTPAPNSYLDLYNLFRFIWPSRNVIGFSPEQLNNMSGDPCDERVKDLNNNISPFYIRVKKSDLKLPPQIINNPQSVDMSPVQKKIYKDLLDISISRLEKGDDINKLKKSILIRLRQAASNPKLLSKPLKETLDIDDFIDKDCEEDLGIKDTLLSIIEDYDVYERPNKFYAALNLVKKIVDENEKIIVWCEFVGTCLELSDFFRENDITNEVLYGGTSQDNRDKIIKAFNDPDNLDFQVVIANPHAVGESISLHMGCHNALYYEQGFNAGVYMQSKDRIHRVGLPRDVITNYYFLQSAGTVEEIVYNRVLEKEKKMLGIIEKEEIPLISMNEDYEQDFEDDIKAIIRAYYERRK